MSFFRKGSEVGPEEMVTVVGAEAYLQGVLSAKGSLRIDGRVEGTISDAQTVVVGPGGRVQGNIAAESVVVSGQVTGDIAASAQIEILASGCVEGDIRAPRFSVEEGAVFNGRCSMNHSGEGGKSSR